MMFSIDKKASLHHKNQKFKTKSLEIDRIGIFPKGLAYDFGQQKWNFSILLFLEQKCQENVFDDILEKKNVCLDN